MKEWRERRVKALPHQHLCRDQDRNRDWDQDWNQDRDQDEDQNQDWDQNRNQDRDQDQDRGYRCGTGSSGPLRWERL